MNIKSICVKGYVTKLELNEDNIGVSESRSDLETKIVPEKLTTENINKIADQADVVRTTEDHSQENSCISALKESSDGIMCLPDLRRSGVDGHACIPDVLTTSGQPNVCMPDMLTTSGQDNVCSPDVLTTSGKANVCRPDENDTGVEARLRLPEQQQASGGRHSCSPDPSTNDGQEKSFRAGATESADKEHLSRCVYKFDMKQLHREISCHDGSDSDVADYEDDERMYKLNLVQNCDHDSSRRSESNECRFRRPRRRSILRLRDGGAIKRINQSDLPLWTARYVSLTTLVFVAVYYLFPSARIFDPNSTCTVFLHLLCFTIHFGAQCWVTFVAGIVLFFNLPRVMFGQVQSRLFPMYFETTLVMSAITLVTFTIRHPYETWDQSDVVQAGVLVTCLVSTLLNAYFIAPAIVSNMLKIFELEHAIGVGYAVGYVDRTELRRDPHYNSCYRRFRQVHGVSGLANIITMVCNTVYLYHLACQCMYFDLR